MRLLLDTHTVLWLASNSPKLSDVAREVVLDDRNEKYVSIVSAWEVAIKLGTGKLHLEGGLPEFYRIIDENGFMETSVAREYLSLLGRIGKYHKDPFDRVLIATALAENFTIITADENVWKYNIKWLW